MRRPQDLPLCKSPGVGPLQRDRSTGSEAVVRVCVPEDPQPTRTVAASAPNASGHVSCAQQRSDKESTLSGHSDVSSQFSCFIQLNEKTVKDYINEHPKLRSMIGTDIGEWTAREVGDGKMNFVYIVEGPKGGLVVKQAPPYVRVVESWPLSQDRVRIEAQWLMEQREISPQQIPEVYHLDQTMAVFVMQYMAPPFKILRLGILDGCIYPHVGKNMSDYLAKALFFTSTLALKSDAYRQKMLHYNNPEPCKIAEQLIFLDAFYDAPLNAYLSPELDDAVSALQNDVDANVAIARLRNLHLSKPQALIHGDLHTGSVMVKEDALFVFDGEFAFYGPIAFDVGKFIANLLLAYFALDGYPELQQSRQHQQEWLLKTVIEVWEGFSSRFLELWNENLGKGDAYPEALFQGSEKLLNAIQKDFIECLFEEALGFASAVLIRRIVTIAQIDDITRIKDRATRAACCKRVLEFSRQVLVGATDRETFSKIQDVVAFACSIRSK